MKRREFMWSAGCAGIACTLPNTLLKASNLRSAPLISDIGIQLFSVPHLLEKNLVDGLGILADMGYSKLELYGPFHFSATSAKERWKSLTPRLGFSGSGFFGETAESFKSILNDLQLTVPSVHTDLETLENHLDDLARAADVIGFEYVGLPAIPPENRTSMEDYKKTADLFNEIGKNARELGLKFAYHNHGYGLVEMEGQVPLKYLIENTDPEWVFLEMDLFWTAAGNADPVEYLNAYPNRYRLMHVKDMKERKSFSGDGGDPAQWMELFPNMCSAGDGVLDLESIISIARKNGVKHFIVEQDMVSEPEIALRRSFEYLKSL